MPSLVNYPSRVESYSFITVSEACDVFQFDYENGGEKHQVGEGNFIDDLEFIEYRGAVPGNLPNYCIVGQYFNDESTIYVQDSFIFFMLRYDEEGNYQAVYYYLLGDVDFYTLIDRSLWRDGEAGTQ